MSIRRGVKRYLSRSWVDQNQATLSTAVVTQALGRSPKARKTRGASGQSKLLQKGMGR